MAVEISSFYDNRELFITGGSGFIGKVIIEKILRHFNLTRLFLLLRPKYGVSLEQRLVDLKADCVFDRLRNENPNALSKLVAVGGDISEIGLGLSPESIELMKNVSIIIHSAATVRFDEPLQKAVFLNVRGTLEALKFAENLKQMVSFVHVSTLYCNPYLDYVEEKVYPSPVDWKNCIEMSETMPHNLMDPLTEKYIQYFPNTYTFTKNLAEQVVKDFQHKLPVAIIRPSVVSAALIEPVPSYLSSKSGTMGILAIAGTGFIRTIFGNPLTSLDQIPVDVVSRSTIILAWQRGTNELPFNQNLPYVSHCSGEGYTIMQVKELTAYTNVALKDYPHELAIWKPSLIVTSNWFYYFFRTFLYQLLPSLLIDQVLKWKGHPPILMKIQRIVFSSLQLLSFFVFKTYLVSTLNSEYLFKIADDLPDFTIESYRELAKSDITIVRICTLATRRHLMKYKDSTLEKSKKLHKILSYVDLIAHIILYYFIVKIAVFRLILLTWSYYKIPFVH